MQIRDSQEILVDKLKTSCCFTGHLLDEELEKKILPVKRKLFKKALKLHKNINPCGIRCFQLKDNELLFWFNINEFTKLLIEDLKTIKGLELVEHPPVFEQTSY